MAADTRLATKLKTWWFRAYPLIFALSYSQAALFEDNQNTKFIVGLARAGYRDIASDWLAGITDPFPLFSFLLTWQVERLGVAVGVHAAFFLLTAVYAMAALWLARQLSRRAGIGPRMPWCGFRCCGF